MSYKGVAAGLGVLSLAIGAAGLLARRRDPVDGAIDMGTLALAARHAARERAVWGTVAFVAAAGALDMVTTHGAKGAAATRTPTAV